MPLHLPRLTVPVVKGILGLFERMDEPHIKKVQQKSGIGGGGMKAFTEEGRLGS
jgi:hypothetical protein